MRILFCTIPAFGHLYPVLPLADAARRAGHDVRFATAGAFVERLNLAGFAATRVGPTLPEAYEALGRITGSPRVSRDDRGRPDIEVGGQLFVDIFGRPTAADLLAQLPAIAPDVVVYDQMAIGAAVAGTRYGVPTICHLVSPNLPPGTVEFMLHDRLASLFSDHGVKVEAPSWYGADGYIDIFPDLLQPFAAPSIPRHRIRPTPFTEHGSMVPSWIGRTDRPLVYLTLGTVVAGDDVLAPAIDGVARLDADVLVALGSADGATLGSLPGNVHVESFVDQATVLRHASLAVHHGGSGTMLAAAAAGVPQVVLPKGADQFFNGDILRATGVADVLEPAEASPDAIAAAARRSIGRLSAVAAAVRDEIASMPDSDGALDNLVNTIAERARRAA